MMGMSRIGSRITPKIGSRINTLSRRGSSAYKMLLEATGDGSGVATLRLQVSSDIIATLTGSARFYTDAGGTAGESTTWNITAGALRTIYLKNTTGSSDLTFSNGKNIIKWGDDNTIGWVSTTNAPKITVEIGKMPLTHLKITGNSQIIGALPAGLIFLYMQSALVSWTYTGALPTGLTTMYIASNGIYWTYTGALPAGLTKIVIECLNSNWTYTGALPSGVNYLYMVLGINWAYSGALPTGLTYVYLNNVSINWTGLDIGNNGNLTYLGLSNYRISKMSSADMVTLLTQMTNRTGTLPASITINDFADYASPPVEVTNAVTALKAAKPSVTTIILGA